MITVRRSAERGHADHGWLDARHTFSFADYHDPRWMGFRTLRVLNEDRVAPGQGFPPHGHRDMEILTVVLEGALRHQDDMGNGSVIRPGEIQRMSAGRGVEHSEVNASTTEPVHLLQIWILPERRGMAPGYEQVAIPAVGKEGGIRRIAGRAGGPGEVRIHQDASVHRADLPAGGSAELPLAPDRQAWVHVAEGDVFLNGTVLAAGDGAAASGEVLLRLASAKGGMALIFDLA